MKKIITAIVALASLSAFAFHPGDEERLMNIGTKTKLKIIKDINIVPNKRDISLGKNCALQVTETKDFDRVLAAGSVLTVTKTIGTYSNADALVVDNTNIQFIYCHLIDKKRPTIGDFKADTEGTIEVQLADPTRI